MKVLKLTEKAIYKCCDKYTAIAWQTKDQGAQYVVWFFMAFVMFVVVICSDYNDPYFLFVTVVMYALLLLQPVYYWCKNTYGNIMNKQCK